MACLKPTSRPPRLPVPRTPPGLLGLPQEDMHRRAKQESVGVQAAWAEEFRKRFEPYDWTKMLG